MRSLIAAKSKRGVIRPFPRPVSCKVTEYSIVFKRSIQSTRIIFVVKPIITTRNLSKRQGSIRSYIGAHSGPNKNIPRIAYELTGFGERDGSQ